MIVSEVGDFLLCSRGTASRIAQRSVSRDDPLYPDLVSNFIISDKPIPDLLDVLATRYRTKKAFLDSFTSLHIIVVTLRCNHSCPYCQVSRQTQDKHQYDIQLVDLDRAIDLAFRSPSPHLTIELQGGEPLLAFDKIRHAVDRAVALNTRRKKGLTFVLCTNLTPINDAMLEFCREHRILISTSLDGPPLIHNANRPTTGADSYDQVIAALGRTRGVLGRDMVSALMTTTRLSLSHPQEIVDSYVSNGFDHIFLRPVSPYGFARRYARLNRYTADEFLAFYKHALEYILDLNRRGTFLVEDYAAIVLRKMLTPFSSGYVDLQSPSGLASSVVVYNYDGSVYASDEARMLAETGDHTFRLGHVSDPYEQLFYSRKTQELIEHGCNEALAGCSECGFQTFCGADPVFHHATQGDFEGYRPQSDYCRRNMEIIRFILELLDADSSAEAIFRSWLP